MNGNKRYHVIPAARAPSKVMRQKYPMDYADIHTDSYYHCCCGAHVHEAAFVLSLICTVLSFSDLLFKLLVDGSITVLASLFTFIGYLCALLANRSQSSSLYIPYFVLATVGILMVCIGATVVLFSSNPETGRRWLFSDSYVAGAFVVTFLHGYFIYIFQRDFHYLKELRRRRSTSSENRRVVETANVANDPKLEEILIVARRDSDSAEQ